MSKKPLYRKGFLLGKFMPPHAGHLHLIDEAAKRCDELIVLVCSIEREPIPGDLRFAWLNELRPQHTLLHCTEEVPQAPEEHPDFWAIWEDLLDKWLPDDVDVVFSSEEYGKEIAKRLGIEHYMVDLGRDEVPVSGTAIREFPLANWKYIPEPVRPYFVGRVAVVGPESSGKSTLTRQLAERFETVHVEEYGREYTAHMENRVSQEIVPEDFWNIACEHARRVEAAARHANKLLFLDTEALTTAVWSEWYIQECEPRLWALVGEQKMNLFLLLEPDLEWQDDGTREFPERRQAHFEKLRSELESRGWPYRVIGGHGMKRLEAAVAAVRETWPETVRE